MNAEKFLELKYREATEWVDDNTKDRDFRVNQWHVHLGRLEALFLTDRINSERYAELITEWKKHYPEFHLNAVSNFYGIYFLREQLRIGRDGTLLNPEVLQIVRFGYDAATDTVTGASRVSQTGEVIEAEWTMLNYSDDLDHVGYDDDESIAEALGRFYRWLSGNLDWDGDTCLGLS